MIMYKDTHTNACSNIKNKEQSIGKKYIEPYACQPSEGAIASVTHQSREVSSRTSHLNLNSLCNVLFILSNSKSTYFYLNYGSRYVVCYVCSSNLQLQNIRNATKQLIKMQVLDPQCARYSSDKIVYMKLFNNANKIMDLIGQ